MTFDHLKKGLKNIPVIYAHTDEICRYFVTTLLYKMPSNLKGKNFVSKLPGYCPQNTMMFFSSKLDGIKK